MGEGEKGRKKGEVLLTFQGFSKAAAGKKQESIVAEGNIHKEPDVFSTAPRKIKGSYPKVFLGAKPYVA